MTESSPYPLPEENLGNHLPEGHEAMPQQSDEAGVPSAESVDILGRQHAESLAQVQEMEDKNASYLRALQARGINPDEDPDYQFFLGQLSMARDGLRRVVAERAAAEIDSYEP